MANKFSTKIKTPEHYILWEKEKTSWQTLIIIAETLMLLAILITIIWTLSLFSILEVCVLNLSRL